MRSILNVAVFVLVQLVRRAFLGDLMKGGVVWSNLYISCCLWHSPFILRRILVQHIAVKKSIPSARRGGASSKTSLSSGAPTKSKSSKLKGLVARLGRVEYDYLEEGEVLGEGTFGTVVSGTYRGRDVAVKKARGAVGSTSIMEAFR